MSVAAQFEANASEDLSSPFYFNASHWRAMDGVVEGVKNREGIMVMTGPTGSGKTMLMRAISDNLGEGATPLFLQYASLNFREFVNFLHNSLNVADEVLDASNKAVALRKFLYGQSERHETAVVFVDEAQNLEPDVLRMLPKLACFDQLEDGTNVGLQFMLTGGSELREVLEDSDFSEVREAVAREYELRFFSREELKYFLEKRLAPLERLTPEPITDDAIEAVGKYTGGSPRLIGMICSHAMLFAAENPGRSIDEAMIEEAAEALMIEPAENAFADEDEDPADVSGPFSSADLSGETDTDHELDIPDFKAAPESSVMAMDTDAGDDADAPAPEFTDYTSFDDASDSSEPEEILEDVGMRRKLDDFDDDLEMDLDGDFDDDAEMDLDGNFDDGLDDDGFELKDAAAPAALAVASGSVLSRVKSAFSGRAKKRGELSQIVGSGRKGRNAVRAAAPTSKRAMKTRVAGQRKKQIKYAGVAAVLCALAFGGYMVRTKVSEVFASAKDTISDTATSAYDTASSTVGTLTGETEATGGTEMPQPDEAFRIEAPDLNTNTDMAALDLDLPLDSVDVGAMQPSIPDVLPDAPAMPDTPSLPEEVLAPNAPAIDAETVKSGWGAKVVVVTEPTPKPERLAIAAPKLPEAGVGLARGALDLLDSALDKTKDVLPEDMGAAIDVAKGDVQNLRTTAATNGATGTARDERIAKLVAEADDYFKKGLYLAPPRGNAYDSYRAALDIDETNEKALRGIEELRAFYSKKAEAARAKKQWDRANRFFETALGISQRKAVR